MGRLWSVWQTAVASARRRPWLWILLLTAERFAENAFYNWALSRLSKPSGGFVTILRWLLEYLPVVTWLVVLMFIVALIYQEERITSQRQPKRASPASPLWIEFDKDDPVCVDKRVVTINAQPRLQFIMFRVLVHNRSDQTVERVRVLLDLRNRPSLGEVPLQFMLDQSKDGAPSIQGFDMDPRTKRYVNVVYWDPENEKLRGLFVLSFAGGGIPNTILTVDPHGIDLTARGRNVPPYTKQFNLHLDEYGIPRFQRATLDRTKPDDE